MLSTYFPWTFRASFAASIIVVTMGNFYVAFMLVSFSFPCFLFLSSNNTNLSLKKYLHYHVGFGWNIKKCRQHGFLCWWLNFHCISFERFLQTQNKVFGRKSSFFVFPAFARVWYFFYLLCQVNQQRKRAKNEKW